ncbi:MAG: tetratricopeptide repeat protein [Calditrichaeota bacterium]|nr:tetratricopeptide repeat protein [Calditrichota bacterium]
MGKKEITIPHRLAGEKDNALPPRLRGGDQRGGARIALLLLSILFLATTAFTADNPRKSAIKGIKHYNQAEYDRALAEFMAGAEADPERSELKYDMGAAFYKLEDFQNASAAFSQAAAEENPKLAADAWYNLGNAMFKSGDMDKAIQSYKNSLYLDHNDPDTKHNLERALLMKQMQQQQQQQQEGDSTGQQQQQQQQQAQPDSSKGEQEQQQQQAQADSTSNDEEQQQPQPKKETDMTPEEALQLLQAMENDEQEAQKEKLERQFGKPKRVEKDW